MKIYKVTEIFKSLQGEGTHAGRPAIFIRLAGCNLKCPWCDTDFTCKHTLTAKEIETIVDQLDPTQRMMVVFTGGEPTLQLSSLESLCDGRYRAIESNGTSFIPGWIEYRVVSPKPGMKQSDIKAIGINELKVVLDGENDPKQWKYLSPNRYIQPCSGDLEPATKYVLAHSGWKLSVQLQKILDIP